VFRMQYNAMRIVGLERKRRESGEGTRRIGVYVEAAMSLEMFEAQLERISLCRERRKMQWYQNADTESNTIISRGK
jgi:hypothetical protein